MNFPDNGAARHLEMRDLTRRAHGRQTRNGGRLPYWVHTDNVAGICDEALRRTGELAGTDAEDLVLAAYGHDLYEDTTVTSAVIRERFGARVDRWIFGMTNRKGDADRGDYLRHLAESEDEIRLIKCADLIDNMLSVAYGLHDLGLDWARSFFLPIAAETRDVLLATPFTRLPATGAYLSGLVDWAWYRLQGSMETAAAIMASGPDTSGDAMSDDEPELSEAAKRMVERLSFTPEEWAESQAKVKAEQERKAKELFGDRKPFAIPDTETDS